MLHVETTAATTEDGPLAPDLPKLVRVVAAWAAERPLVYDVSLFGRRIRPGHDGLHPLQCAVRFDNAHLISGFDDWIEDLRSNFASLAEALGEPVTVVTPDMRPAWNAIVHGTEFRALTNGKVRVVTAEATPAAALVPQATSQRAQPSSRWSAVWHFLAAATAPRRPAL